MGISIGHLLILLVILMLIFGPSRLEGIGSSLGKAVRGFKDAIDGIDEAKASAQAKTEVVNSSREQA